MDLMKKMEMRKKALKGGGESPDALIVAIKKKKDEAAQGDASESKMESMLVSAEEKEMILNMRKEKSGESEEPEEMEAEEDSGEYA